MTETAFTNPGSLENIPNGWELMSIDELCLRVTSGGTPSRKRPEFYLNGEHNWFKTKELNDSILHHSEEKITMAAVEASSAKILPANTVLMAMYGDGKTITSLGILSTPSSCNQACCAMIANPEVCDHRFLFYALKYHRQDFLQIASGGAQRNLSGSLIRRFGIKTPPLDEQRRIAHILGTLDDKIELNRQMNKTLDEIARTIFRSWFVDFDPVRAKMEGRQPEGMDADTAALFPDRLVESELGLIPEGWGWKPLDHFASIAYGAPFASRLFNTDRRGKPLIRIRDLATHSPGVWTEEEHKKGTLISPGDLIIGMDGEFRAHIWTGPASWLNQRVCALWPADEHYRSYLRYAMETPLAFFERSKTGTTVIHIGKSDLDSIQLLDSSTGVMKCYSQQMNPVIDLLVANVREIQILSKIRDQLLPVLLRSNSQS